MSNDVTTNSVLSKAVINAAAHLDLSDYDLCRILGLDEAAMAQIHSGTYISVRSGSRFGQRWRRAECPETAEEEMNCMNRRGI
jgi:hypothetical protein